MRAEKRKHNMRCPRFTVCLLCLPAILAFQPLHPFAPPRQRRVRNTTPSLHQQEFDLGAPLKDPALYLNFTIKYTDIAVNNISKLSPDIDSKTDKANEKDLGFGSTVCRVVAVSDGKIPSSKRILPRSLSQKPKILEKLDSIYYAMSHVETRRLAYMDRKSDRAYCIQEEEKLVTVLRNSLEDAGFERLSQRDLDLCDALNVGYLLRLSIDPDLRDLNPCLSKEFYPECADKNETDGLLFDGKVLIYRRGYSTEVTTGRLLLPKLDYLQASIVQRSVSAATQQLGVVEKNARKKINAFANSVRSSFVKASRQLMTPLSILARRELPREEELNDEDLSFKSENTFFKLSRYGGRNVKFVGSPDLNDALTPFLICELTDKPVDERAMQNVDHEIYEALNEGEFTCQYDSERRTNMPLPTTLLKRVSISSIVDVVSKEGRSKLLKRFFSQSELVEPTFEEVVVIWRPSAKKQRAPLKVVPPKLLYDLAEVLDMEKLLPQKLVLSQEPDPLPLEIRAFADVPMANLPAVLPKTKLVFRPADALLNDFISVATFALIAFSFKFDSPRLELIAIISFGLWIFRTIIRYSNKLARYDLLVKRFLTSKIAHRDAGALEYIITDAGSQRALRASLVHSWLLQRTRKQFRMSLTREQLIQGGLKGVNNALATEELVNINISAALNDLEDLKLIKFDGQDLESVEDQETAVSTLMSTWMSIFNEEGISLQRLVGRRT
jgi:hypothetical protein